MKSNIKSLTTISAVVTKDDGTKIDLGTISNSSWPRLSVRRYLSSRRIRKANRGNQ